MFKPLSSAARQRGVALLLALLPATAFSQQNPGLSERPSGQTLEGSEVPAEDKPVDLSRPEPEPVSAGMTAEEEALFAAAMRGEAWAQAKLGTIYVTSASDELRLQRGIDLLRKAGQQNDAEALFELSKLAASGRGMPQSDIDAFDYCSKAATLGLTEAQQQLGTMYASGRGTIQDREAAISWYKKAATSGYAPAKYSLALALLASRPENEDNRDAIGWLQSAAKDGHREAIFFLAGAIAHGDYGLEKDERKAAEMALPRAEAGDPEFQFALATLYLRGESFGDRREEGRVWLEKAASSGQREAQLMLQEKNSPAQ